MRIVALSFSALAEEDRREAAVAAAATLAAEHGLSFDVIVLGSDTPAEVPAPGPGGRTFAFVHEHLTPESSPGNWAIACAEALKEAALESAFLLLAPPSAFGQAFGAQLALAADLYPLGHCEGIAIDGDVVRVRRAAFGGRASIAVEVPGRSCVAQMRTAINGDAPALIVPDEVRVLTGALPPSLSIEIGALDEQGARLEDATIIVSGGRGLDAEAFALLEVIANSLDGAVGASLAAIDAGLAPVSRQIGQSGKFVTPRAYLAVGLSGTPQHLAGIGMQTKIFAINNDPHAPIFKCAELGIIADGREALHLLHDHLIHRNDDQKITAREQRATQNDCERNGT